MKLLQIFEELGPKKYMPWGMKEAVNFIGIYNGDVKVDFIFENEEGSVRKTFSEPDAVFDPVAEHKALKEIYDSLAEFLQIVVPEELHGKYLDLELTDFRSAITNIEKALETFKNDGNQFNKVNLKLLPGGDSFQFANFPRFGKFIEKHKPGIPHTFTWTDWELNNRVNPALEYKENMGEQVSGNTGILD